jgi:hypothetical protein
MLRKATSHEIIRSALFDINNQYDNRIDDIDTSLLVESALLIAFESHKSEHKEVLQNIAHSVCNYALTIERAKIESNENTLDEDRDFLALIERSGASVRVLVKEGGYIADMWHFEAEQIANSILRAAKDAKAFQKAQTEWVGVQMQRLNCEIKGTQNMWGYGFYVNGRHYEVHFTTNEIARTCVILNQAAKPIFQKVTEDVSKVSQDDAALLLKTFLISKIKEDEECQSK